MNFRQPPREVDHVIQAIRPAAFLDDTGLRRLDASSPLPPARYEPDTAFVTWTSGTTGPPKPILQTHSGYREILGRVLSSIRKGSAAPPPRPPSPNLVPVSLALNAGIYNLLFGFMAGAPVVLMERFVPRDFATLVARYGIRSTVLPPAAMTMLTDSDSDSDSIPFRFRFRFRYGYRRRGGERPQPVALRPLHHRPPVAPGGQALHGQVRRDRPQRVRPGRDRGGDRVDRRRRPHPSQKLGAAGRPHAGVASRWSTRKTAHSVRE